VAAGTQFDAPGLLVCDENADRVIAERVVDQCHDLAEEIAKRLDRNNLPRDVVNQPELPRALLRRLEGLRVADRARRLVCQQREQAVIFVAEAVRLVALDRSEEHTSELQS